MCAVCSHHLEVIILKPFCNDRAKTAAHCGVGMARAMGVLACETQDKSKSAPTFLYSKVFCVTSLVHEKSLLDQRVTRQVK